MSPNLSTASPSTADGLAVIVVAAGSGTRLGCGMPKALVPLNGRSLLDRSLDTVTRALPGSHVTVTVPAGDTALTEVSASHGARAVAGGATRAHSVASGLAALPASTRYVLVHDAARCLTPAAVLVSVAAELRSGTHAVVPVLPVSDTVRGVDAQGHSTGTVDRTALRSVQTPQGFRMDLLVEVNVRAGLLQRGPGGVVRAVDDAQDPEAITDDASLVERFTPYVPVTLVPGHEESFKVTRPLDLITARAVLDGRGNPS